MTPRHYITITYWLLATRMGWSDVKARAERVRASLNIRPAALCTCALPLKYKTHYNTLINEARNGKSRVRTINTG